MKKFQGIFRVILAIAIIAGLALAVVGKPMTSSKAAGETVRVNQVGYLPNMPKKASAVNASGSPLAWQLKNSSGVTVASGSTTVFGFDSASGENIHIADFSSYTTPGTGYTLTVAGSVSYPFDISSTVYRQMKYDALAYFYHNRSGIAITMPYAGGSQWTHAAGHLGVSPNQGDTNVACQPTMGCNYTLDVRGGWYDAGDHGKYIVTAGISSWTLLNQYERMKYFGTSSADFANGKMNIPENANGVNDLLDEARWEIDFMLRMQVPAGRSFAGMVHNKVHDAAWTGIPTRPEADSQVRYLHPVTTQSTLQLAAVGAQCARIWQSIDATFANKCLVAAETAWNAAQANPTKYVVPGDGTGGGEYGDNSATDEFYWAAAELYITTGNNTYKNFLTSSSKYKSVSEMTWEGVTALGTISLAVVPNNLGATEISSARSNIITAANGFLSTINAQGYRVPISSYPWGSNSFITNNLILTALAGDFTGDGKYAAGVSEGMDYILGRNAMNKSYVSGYGENPLNNPHHRFWAFQASPSSPRPPAGAISGGPNTGLEDPVAQAAVTGCKPQKCYLDDIGAWSVNEITINWNAPFAWVAAYLDEKAGTVATPTPTATGPTPTSTKTLTATATLAAPLSLNQPVTCSSVEAGTTPTPCANAVDGNSATRWASLFTDPQWIYVDLGTSKTINRVVLNWEAAYATAFQIQTSNDATNWTTIRTVTGNTALVNDLTVTGSGRYVRVYGTARATVYGYSLWEFSVYGSGGPVITLTPTPTSGTGPIYKDPNAAIVDRVNDLLSRMTLDEKIGQMIQSERASTSNTDVSTLFIGSILNGGGSVPGTTPASWADMYDAYQQAALSTRLGIPIIYGFDAVHGANNIHGATMFPHNIRLGSTRDPDLIKRISKATAEEIAGTGIDWTFAPCLCVARNERWGRTYESFSENPTLVSTYNTAIDGYQGTSLNGPTSILATAKHYVGDGGTSSGTNTGNTVLTEAELRALHLSPYLEAIRRNVGSFMISYSSWNGLRMHANQYLITTVLKNELGFKGIVITDWNGIHDLDGTYTDQIRVSVNAGIDMFMEPTDYKLFIPALRGEVNAGRVSTSRIDDAVRRILTKKFELGLFEKPFAERSYLSTIGSAAHRTIAREAVRKSLVLLKNDNNILPLSKTAGKIYVAGKNADDIGNQSGGWTISWQGDSGNITPGTTILQGIRNTVSGATVTYDKAATSIDSSYSVAVVVVGETPYAEGAGDRTDLALDTEDLATLARVKASGVPTVVILVSGRPMIITNQLPDWRAFIAAWLPGTEGQGVADVLFGDYAPTGKLSFSWPRTMAQLPINVGDATYDPLFAYDFGLTFGQTVTATPTRTPTVTVTGTTPTPTVTATVTLTPTGPSLPLSQGKPVTCSSTEVGTTPCSNAVDGNLATRWSSAFADPQWISVDLGSSANISRVVLNWEPAYASAYQIQTSNDNTNWTTIRTVTGNTTLVNDLSVTGSGRYVRMYGTTRATAYGYSLWEFQVYGSTGPIPTSTQTATPSRTPTKTVTPTPVVCGTTDLALNRPATSSSNETSALTPNLAVDGNGTTRWASAFADNQWIQVDLGTSRSICRVRLVWEAAYASSYQVLTSNDGVNWTMVRSVSGNTTLTNDLTLSGTGRYVRVLGITRATPYGISLYTFEVY